MNVREELEAIGVRPEAAEHLAQWLANPPTGVLDREDEAVETRAHAALHAGLVASVEWMRFALALRTIVAWLEGELAMLSGYDSARFWHIRGLAAFRLEESISGAIRALNASTRLLAEDPSERARRYRPRVLDTFGQLLYHQGLFHDARRELENALALRDAVDDRTGMAITLGNLGRLCIDLGDFASAARYLERDIEIVEELMPDRARTRSQLLTHLAQCRLHLGEPDAAESLLVASEQHARDAGDRGSEVFVLVGRGAVMIARGDDAGALRAAEGALGKLELEPPSALRSRLVAAAQKLAGHARARIGDLDEATESYRVARRELSNVSGASPIEHAEILRSLAGVLARKNETVESAQSLRLALGHLDATAAEAMRRDVEAALKQTSYDSWLLHSAGRFIGQQQIELLLSEAGEEGFRGERRRVTVLFSDIRGFTSLSERLPADQLIVLLNDLLTQMTRSIERHVGVVDKFIGDAVMALFHLDRPERSATDAILAGLAMRDELERFNHRLDDALPPIAMGVGLHTGEVIAGLIGSPQKRAYTVIGDVVNTASRIEGMTKQLGASILVTSETLAAADVDRFLLRPLGSYRPKGRTAALRVFDVLGERDRSPASRAAVAEISRMETALAMFESREFDRAAEVFSELERQSSAPQSVGYALLGAQSKKLSMSPPPPEWSGDIMLVEK